MNILFYQYNSFNSENIIIIDKQKDDKSLYIKVYCLFLK